MGFCTEDEYQEFMLTCPEFERMLVRSGIVLIKYWFSVSDAEQERRFQDRMNRPMETGGAATLRAILRDRVQPLSAVVIDAHIDSWERRLPDAGGPLLAMRSVATVIAGLIPPDSAGAIRRITQNEELLTLDERMRPVTNPELPEIARALPADTAYQITRAAERLGYAEYSDVLVEVVNAVTRDTARPQGVPRDVAPQLAGESFPHPPPSIQFSAGPAAARLGSRPQLARTKRLPSP